MTQHQFSAVFRAGAGLSLIVVAGCGVIMRRYEGFTVGRFLLTIAAAGAVMLALGVYKMTREP